MYYCLALSLITKHMDKVHAVTYTRKYVLHQNKQVEEFCIYQDAHIVLFGFALFMRMEAYKIILPLDKTQVQT